MSFYLLDRVVRFVQICTWPVFYILFRVFYKSKVDLRVAFDSNGKYIFAANHKRYEDPFIIFYSLPFRVVKQLLPLRFMTTQRYMDRFILGKFLVLFGCYGAKNDSLNKTVDFLNRGNNVCIFPQGKFDKKNKEQAKVGVAYIHREVKGSCVVPINIDYPREGARIIFIKKMIIKKFSKDLQPLANRILRVIHRKK